MIGFRCWYCNKKYSVAEDRAGQRKPCTCGRRIKVPRYTGGSSRSRTASEFLVEAVVYGGGLGLLCMLLGFAAGSRAFGPSPATVILVAGCGLGGFVVGALGGERVIDWVGRRIRGWEDDRRYGQG